MYVTDLKCVLQVQLYSFAGSSLNWGIYTSCIFIFICVNIVCTSTNKEFGGLILKYWYLFITVYCTFMPNNTHCDSQWRYWLYRVWTFTNSLSHDLFIFWNVFSPKTMNEKSTLAYLGMISTCELCFHRNWQLFVGTG